MAKPSAQIGQTVLYTDEKGKVRAATVLFMLTNPAEPTDIRPVLRVMIPMAMPLGGMPPKPATCAAGQKDYEVYGARQGSPGEKLTWYPLPVL